MEKTKGKPEIRHSLLWECDLETFNWDKSYKIVNERVIQRGDLKDWQEMNHFYTREKILETVDWSKQLEQRDKDFTRQFLTSDLLYVA